MLYFLKFTPPFKHAKYYFGCCEDENLYSRVHQHLVGNGAKIVKRAIQKGHGVGLCFSCQGTFEDEKRYKKWNNNGRVLERLRRIR